MVQAFSTRYRVYEKKRPRELAAVLENFNRYFNALNAGVNPLQVKFGFIHSEGKGVIAIDQRGHGRNLAQTGMYLYADMDSQTLHQIALGDKTTQKHDVRLSHEFVNDLNKEKNDQNEDETNRTDESGSEDIQERSGDGT